MRADLPRSRRRRRRGYTYSRPRMNARLRPSGRVWLRTLLKYLPWAMIAGGLAIAAFALISRLSVSSEQKRLVEAYRVGEQGAAVSAVQTAPQKSALAELPDPDAAPQPGGEEMEETDPATLAVLTIPSIGLEVAVREGVKSSSLKYSVGHFPLSAMPGEADNCVILGHRNYTYGEFFNRLDELAAGDEVLLERGGMAYTYTVAETFVVEPADTWVLDPADEPVLTLITCTPVRAATHRLIVRCALTGVKKAG